MNNFSSERKIFRSFRCAAMFFLVFMIPFALFLPDGYSQTRTKVGGEIINVNHHLQVAFVDIGRRDLSKGDVVEVQIDQQTVVYMEVLESSAVISKIGIGPVVTRHFSSNTSDFDQIKIGNIVGKVGLYDPNPLSAKKKFQKKQSTSNKISIQIEESIKEIEQFKNGNDISKKEYSEAGQEGQGCQTNIIQCMERNKRLKSKLLMLREKLEYMQGLINKNSLN